MNGRILITGGAGYIGSDLTERLLDAGFAVAVIDNMMYQQRSLFHLCANPELEFVDGDAWGDLLMRRLSNGPPCSLQRIGSARCCGRVWVGSTRRTEFWLWLM